MVALCTCDTPVAYLWRTCDVPMTHRRIEVQRYTGPVQTLLLMLQEEGPLSLLAGLLPRVRQGFVPIPPPVATRMGVRRRVVAMFFGAPPSPPRRVAPFRPALPR